MKELKGFISSLMILVVLFGLVFASSGGAIFDFSAHASVVDGDGDAIAISGPFAGLGTNRETITQIDQTNLQDAVQVRSTGSVYFAILVFMALLPILIFVWLGKGISE